MSDQWHVMSNDVNVLSPLLGTGPILSCHGLLFHVVSYCVFSCHVFVPDPRGAVYGTDPMLSCHGMFCHMVFFHVISMDVPDPGGAVYGRVPSPGPPHPRALISEA